MNALESLLKKSFPYSSRDAADRALAARDRRYAKTAEIVSKAMEENSIYNHIPRNSQARNG